MKILTGKEPYVEVVRLPRGVRKFTFEDREEFATVPIAPLSEDRTVWLIYLGPKGRIGTQTLIAWDEPKVEKRGYRTTVPQEQWTEEERQAALENDLQRIGAPDDVSIERLPISLLNWIEYRITFWEVTL